MWMSGGDDMVSRITCITLGALLLAACATGSKNEGTTDTGVDTPPDTVEDSGNDPLDIADEEVVEDVPGEPDVVEDPDAVEDVPVEPDVVSDPVVEDVMRNL